MAQNPQTSGGTARDKARRIQQEEEAKQRRTSVLLRVGVVVVALVVVLALTLFIVNQRSGEDRVAATEGPAPASANEQGGIALTSATEIVAGDDLGTIDASDVPESDSELPLGVEPGEDGEPPHLIVYADANCVHCASFENQHGEQIKEWADAGEITVEYRMVGFLDGNSNTNYSSRAANAMVCMAEESPENYLDYLAEVVGHQPQGELSNDELLARAEAYDVDIESCVQDGTYRPFVTYTSRQATGHGVQGTPTVYLDDQDWGASEMGFREFVEAAIGEDGDDQGAGDEDADDES
ncbi:DsbA family protein [Nesterenkonia sp. HG001]|uniref:DsbA family protein n=1 Tax=Nesterenkonia sp. HG001 TaxID=2983207 RepID=UPI002AC714DC|nr:thioredoxin domain-containing protein [Nesterenkonia sp. HG001]MDZ5078935.1 DsbA family protein [Nesterenkonia sp. HG001]